MTGPNDEAAKARARHAAERLIREAALEAAESSERLAISSDIVTGLDDLDDNIKEAAAFFRQPYKTVVSELLSEDGQRRKLIERAFHDFQRAERAETEVEALLARIAELEAVLSAQGRAAASLGMPPQSRSIPRLVASVSGSRRIRHGSEAVFGGADRGDGPGAEGVAGRRAVVAGLELVVVHGDAGVVRADDRGHGGFARNGRNHRGEGCCLGFAQVHFSLILYLRACNKELICSTTLGHRAGPHARDRYRL